MSISETSPASAFKLKSGWFSRLPLSIRLAIREMRAGLGGFGIFIACIALGVMVITGVGALTDTLRSGLQDQGRLLIGGDISIARMHTRLTEPERNQLAEIGAVSETSTMRTMARSLSDDDQALIELKAVGDAYPLVGNLELRDGQTLKTAFSDPLAAAVDPILLERLGIKVGDQFTVGATQLTATALIEKEPDALGDRLTFGPRVLVKIPTFDATGLLKPGALVRWRYALAIPDAIDNDPGLVEAREDLAATFKDKGFTVVDRRAPSPDVTRTLDRLREFLTLIGLTALMVGGVGVANAVASFIDKRRKSIATLKSIGAASGQIFSIFLTQILCVTLIGIAIGLAGGLIVPVIVNTFFGDVLPVPATVTVSFASIGLAVAYGLLVALLFSLWPLGRAELVPSAVLFRDDVSGDQTLPRRHIVLATILVAAALFAISILASDSRRVAFAFSFAIIAIFSVFFALGWLVSWGARRMPRSKIPELALAVGNLGAPGGLTRSVVLSLGSGLSLLMAVALADSSIVAELKDRLPENSPDYFVLDIPREEIGAFRQTVLKAKPETKIFDAPMLRGRIVAIGDTPAEEVKARPESRWVLNGDRGITYADEPPAGSNLTEGEWWPADYDGEPLVSFEDGIAKGLGLKIGDKITVNVLGRNITAKIANFRKVEWESLTINFVMVFSSNTLRGAPTNILATVTLPEGSALSDEADVSRAITKDFPTTTVLRVRDAIAAFGEIFGKVMMAVRVAGGVTLIAGALVLAGALATAQRRRVQEAVILKALGATQRRILSAHAIEYALLALVTAGFAILLGGLAAWATLTYIMDVRFTFSWLAVGQAIGLASGLVLLFGGLGTWQALRARPVPYLRSE
ncbi:MAG: FtsX-like permease family protein [Pseudomonadota bacterium]